jgi:hypothetical protein
MAKRFTQVKLDAFKEIQVEAGVITKKFNPANPILDRADIVCVTTGGITINAKPTFTDYFEDVDNVPNNTKEGKQVDDWECTLSTTALDTSAEGIKLSLGVADIDPNDQTRITPRRDIKLSDFADSLWWVGDRADGGFVACQVLNVLSTDGFSLKTTKKGKGQTGLTLMGHYSIDAVDTVPMNFYVVEGDDDSTSLVLDKGSFTVEAGNDATITATTVPAGKTVTWQSLDEGVATVVGGVVTGVAAGTTQIIASFTDDSVTYSALCSVTVTGGEG